MTESLRDFKAIVIDNERAAQSARERGDFLQTFLLIHTLIESLLRQFLSRTGPKPTFAALIASYGEYLERHRYPRPEFVDELTQFNRRRNRIVHQLWSRGYTVTNEQARPAASAAVVLYGLFIEWLETFNPEIIEEGFRHS